MQKKNSPTTEGKKADNKNFKIRVTDLYLKTGDDAGLADADALLLHGLVYARPVRVVHLVELVDQADALVSQHQGPCLQRPLLPGDIRTRILEGKEVKILRGETSSKQGYGSGSTCFWDYWIRIHQSEVWILLSPSKKSKKNLDSYCFVTSF